MSILSSVVETPLFSVSIICKNEEEVLPRLLNSLNTFINAGGEIILVDTGSTDKSIDILTEKYNFFQYQENVIPYSLKPFSHNNNVENGFKEYGTDTPISNYPVWSIEYVREQMKNSVNPINHNIILAKSYVEDLEESSKLRYQKVDDKFIFYIDDEMVNKIHSKFLAEEDDKFAEPNKKVFDFGSARRYAGSLCKNKWILSLDCDEIVTNLDINFLNKIIRTGDVDQLSFVFRYKKENGEITSITSRDKFYNREVGDWKWVVHEQVMVLPTIKNSIRICNVTEYTLSVDHIQHPAEHRSNYLISMCVDVLQDPECDRHTHWLGREFMYRGYYRSAIKLLEHYLNGFLNAWSAEKCMSCIFIGECYIKLIEKSVSKYSEKIHVSEPLMRQQFEQELLKQANSNEAMNKILIWYLTATLYEPTFREPWLYLAEYCLKNNRVEHAILYAETSLKINRGVNSLNYMNDIKCYQSKPYKILYKAYLSVNNKKEAYNAYVKALDYEPENEELLKDLDLFK